MSFAKDYLSQNAHVLQPIAEHYPKQIKGDLRVILQTKDVFLQIKVMLDEYRKLNCHPTDLTTKEFLEVQIHQGNLELQQLHQEVKSLKRRLLRKATENDELCANCVVLGYPNIKASLSPRRVLLCRSPVLRTKAKYRDVKDSDSDSDHEMRDALDASFYQLIDLCREIETKARGVIDLYHDVLSIHMHFMLVITQFCTYTMPLVTENSSIMDRVFFWSYRPELEMVRHNTELADRLKDIYTSSQYFLTHISEMVNDLKEKLKLLYELEVKFRERLTQQQHRRDSLLRKVHSIRHDIDVMNEENDRLIGLIVKTDPSFINSRQFRIAANPHIMARRLRPGSKTASYATTTAAGTTATRKSKKTKSQEDEAEGEPERGRRSSQARSDAKNKNQSGSVLGEVTISAGSTDSLKNNLIQRTRSMFEAAMGRIEQSQDSRIDGCVLAEISEVSDDQEEERRGGGLRIREAGSDQNGQNGQSWRNNSNLDGRGKSCEELPKEVRPRGERRRKKKKPEKRQKHPKPPDPSPSQEESSFGYVVRL